MASTTSPATDLSAMLEAFKIPGVDLTSMPEGKRKEVQALVDANRKSFEQMGALARKQMDVFRETMQEMQTATAAALIGADPMQHAKLGQEVWVKALTDIRDLAEASRKTQTEALDVLSKRAQENLQGIRRLAQPKK